MPCPASPEPSCSTGDDSPSGTGLAAQGLTADSSAEPTDSVRIEYPLARAEPRTGARTDTLGAGAASFGARAETCRTRAEQPGPTVIAEVGHGSSRDNTRAVLDTRPVPRRRARKPENHARPRGGAWRSGNPVAGWLIVLRRNRRGSPSTSPAARPARSAGPSPTGTAPDPACGPGTARWSGAPGTRCPAVRPRRSAEC